MTQFERLLQIETFGTAEAFYKIFLSLPLQERMTIVYYILEDKDVQKNLTQRPNQVTLEAFAENRQDMPLFHTIDELEADLLS